MRDIINGSTYHLVFDIITMAIKKTNRDYLLTMLKSLEGKRAAAKGLKVLVEKNLVNEDQIMQLMHTFLDVIYETHTKIDLNSLKKSMK
jgi:hypothetical protein